MYMFWNMKEIKGFELLKTCIMRMHIFVNFGVLLRISINVCVKKKVQVLLEAVFYDVNLRPIFTKTRKNILEKSSPWLWSDIALVH